MTSKTAKRSATSLEESSLSDSASTREDEKTIPFLRRLTDMLRENDEVISFFPGYRRNGQVVLGRIVVHDRHKVEADVLPRYFNHASFASLRRQLNYFRFTRIGKGRQRGATYCNEAVVVLEDILHLKRRTVGNNANPREGGVTVHDSDAFSMRNKAPAEASPAHPPSRLPSHQAAVQVASRTKRSRNSKVGSFSAPSSPRSPCLSSINKTIKDEPEQVCNNNISVDLSTKQTEITGSSYNVRPCAGFESRNIHQSSGYGSLSVDYSYLPEMYLGDADILAGCNALLSFSRSHHSDGIKYTA